MNTLLVKMGAASKKRSLLLLLLLAGLFNGVSAATYYTATTGTATLTTLSSYSGIFTNIGATTPASGTLLAADVIIVQGATLTTNVSINVQATSGGLTVSGGTATINAASTFSGAVTVSGTSTVISFLANTSFTINNDVTIGTGGTINLLATTATSGGSTVTVSGNLIMTGGILNMAANSNFRFSGNIGRNASASQTGWGLITGRSASSQLTFNRSSNLGTGGAATANTVTIGAGANPQLINYINGSSADAGTTIVPTTPAASSNSIFVRINGYVQVVNNSALPQGCFIAQSNVNSCIDLNGFNLSMGFFSGTPVVVRGGSNANGISSLQLNSNQNGSSGNSSSWGSSAFDLSTPGSTNLVNINMTMGASYNNAANGVIRGMQLTTDLATNYTTSLTNVSSSGTTITCTSTSGLSVGTFLTVSSGTGAFAANTQVLSITGSTSFVVSAAPTTALSGATVAVTWLTSGVIYLNGYNVSGPRFPVASTTANNNSLFSIGGGTSGVQASINTLVGGSLTITSPPSSGSAILPLGIPNGTASVALNNVVHTPVTFANTTSSPNLTVTPSVLNTSYVILTGASSSSTTITCASTSGLAVGATVVVLPGKAGAIGTGAFAANTTVTSITDATHFVVSAAPSTALVGATVSAYTVTPYSLSLTAASSSGTTVTCASTAGLRIGTSVTVSAGTGAFAASTTVTAITSSTQFTVSATPSTDLSAATILTDVGSNVFGDATTTNNTVPYQYAITSSVSGAQSDITFQYPTINSGLTTPSSTAQLGAISSSNISGYTGMTTNLATLTLAGASAPYTAAVTGYTIPGSANATNTFVIGNLGAVYPLPTLANILSTTIGLSSSVNIALSGTNIVSLTSSGKPAWLILSRTSSTAGTLTGTSQSSSSSASITINAVNVAGTASRTFSYTEANSPNITSDPTATAVVGSSINYVVTTSSSADSYAISGSLPSGLSFSTSTGAITGTPDAGSAGSYSLTLTATNSGSGLSGNPFSLTIQVLDAPTVTTISPTTQAVDFGTFIITVNGTNFVNGFSTVTFAGSNLTTTFVSTTQLTATVPASLVARTVASSTRAVGVTNSGTNASPSTPTTASVSSNTTNYTITVATPTITAVSPAATVVGAPTTTITVTGTNFITGVSTVTFNGSATGVTTTYVSTTSLTATLSSTLLSSAGVAAIRVSNNGAGLTVPSAASVTFTVYAAGAIWPLTSSGAPIVGANSSAVTLSTASGSTNILPSNSAGTNASYTAAGLKYIATTSNTLSPWPIDNVTINSLFVGNNSNDASQNRYIQFDAAPSSGNNLTVSHIIIPFSNFTTTQGTYFRVAYSLDGFTSAGGVVDLGTVGGATVSGNPNSGFIATGSTRTYSYTTPIIVPNGQTLSVRVIPIGSGSGFMSSAYINLANVVIGGTATTAYPSPVITSATGTVNGDAADTYTAGTPLYTFAASTTQGTVTYSASGFAGTGYSLDANTGKITGTYVNTSGGTFNATLTADNGNLFPTSTTLTFNINGKPLTPTVTTISPSTSKVDTTAFTITVNGTNFVSGKSAVTWNGTPLTTTYLSATQLTAAVPASYVAGNVITDNTVTIGVYNTDADVPASTVNQTYTITNTTPTITALSPAGVIAGNADFTLTVYGSNFHTGSKIIFNGTQLTTTFVNSFQLSATVAAANVAVAGTKGIVVNNVFPNGASQSTASSSFIVGNTSATWSMASLTPSSSGAIVVSAPTLTNYTTSTNGNGVTYNEVFPGGVADGSNSTADPTFAGLTTAPGSALVAAKSIDFKVTPADNTQMTISAITIPILANGNGMQGVIGYSTDGTNFTKISTATNTSSATGASTIVNTNDFGLGNGNLSVTNYVFPSPISIPNGTILTIRVIPWRKSSTATVVPVNIGPLTVIGNTTPQTIPDAPTISSLADGASAVDVSFTAPLYTGTTSITSYKVYAYANGSGTAAKSVSANVSSLTLPYHINVTGLTNGTSYTFKVSATNGAGEGALSTISNAVIPSNSTTWTVTNGVGSWDHGDPDLGDQNATINGNYTLTKALNCLKLTVASNVTVALGNFNFTVQGNLVNDGTVSGTGTLLLNTTAAQTIAGSGTVGNVTINNTSGGVSVITGNMFNVSGVLTLQSGVLTTNSRLTFKSTSIANTGTLAAYGASGNTGTISGTVIVERYIPAGFRGYRDLAPQVNNAGSIYNNWQEAGAFTSGKGIFITGPGATDANVANYATQPAPNSAGLDYSINGVASAFTYNNTNGSFYSLYSSGKIDSIYNTKTINLEPFTGYRVLVRGDRSFNLATTPIVNYYNIGLRMVNATVLRSTGNVITGTVTYATNGVTNTSVGSTYRNSVYGLNATAGKFSMIANPYIAPIQWGTGTGTNSSTTTVYGASSNINGSYWYYDTKFGSTGTYAAYNALTGSVYAGNTTSGFIQPGQAFFVQTSASSPTVVINESAKATSVAKVAVFGAAAPLSKIYFSLLKQNASNTYNTVDAAAIAFHESFTNATYGPQDAIKFGNNNDYLSISDKGKSLSIDGRLPATATDKIPVNISNVSGTAYQLDIDATTYSVNGFAPYLVDSYKGTTATLTSGLNSFKFTVDAKVAASFENRFSIAFKPTTLAVNSIVATAKLNNKIATISWNTVGEKGVSRFEVEKSIDAKSFVKIGQASAKNTATASYTSTDNSVSATTYYRIKAISEVGTVSYSNVAQLTINRNQFSVYPNPFVGITLNVSFGNVAAGNYTVTINNVLGQRVQEVSISHAGGNVSHAITVNNKLAAGNYSITIRETASGQLVHQTNLSVQP